MTRLHLAMFTLGALLASLLAHHGAAVTVGLVAVGCPVAAVVAGLVDAWRTRRTEWAGIDARHATTRILDQEGRS